MRHADLNFTKIFKLLKKKKKKEGAQVTKSMNNYNRLFYLKTFES